MYIRSKQMESVSLYSEARTEYMKQLSIWIIPPLVEFFRKEYNAILAKEGKRTMALFQKYCADVPLWNQDIIDVNIGVILDSCRCDYVEELMTAVFVAHTKMLTAIRVNSRQKKLQITLPKLDHFLHRVFVECARAFWKAPFLFSEDLSPIERQKNILQAEVMCTEALSGAVRSLLPVKSILRDYLEDDDAEEEEEEKPKKKINKQVEESVEESVDEEKPVVVAPVEEKPVVVAPVEEKPVVVAPVEEKPVVVVPLVEEKPVIVVPPVEEKPVVVAPVEEKPVVVAPIEEKPVVVAPVEEKPVIVAPPVVADKPVVEIEDKPLNKGVTIEKLDSSPLLTIPSPSVEKTIEMPSKAAVGVEKSNETVMIDTEPSVHFTPYDTVFDETTANISEIRYTPKVDKSWDDAPKLTIGSTSSALELNEMVNLDADIDTPLTSTSDFEVLS
jgi:hypothetical protein